MRKRDNPNPYLEAAILAIESIVLEKKPADPKDDLRWVLMNQLHKIYHQTLEECYRTEYQAKQARYSAQKAYAETKARLELLEIELGIEEETEENHEQE